MAIVAFQHFSVDQHFQGFKVCYLTKNHGKVPELPSDGRNGMAFSSECVCLRTTNDTVCPLRMRR